MKQVTGPIAANAWLLFLLLPVIILAPVFLLVIVPGAIVVTIVMARKPKRKPETLDEWWDENWRRYL